MNSPKHILLVSNTAFSFWNFRREVIRDMISQGYQVTCMSAPDDCVGKLKDIGVDFISIPFSRSGMNIVVEMITVLKLWAAIYSIRPDLMISYTIKPNSYVPVLSWVLQIPCLSVVTGLGFAFLKNNFAARLARLVLKYGLRFAKKIWFLNNDDMNVVTADSYHLQQKSEILPGEGIDTDFFNDQLFPRQIDKPFVFLMIARILKDKGFIEFCEAAQIIHQDNPAVEFWILGSIDPGNPASLSQSELSDISNQYHVRHYESVSDVRPFLAKADVCVLPSYREGIPMVLLEAGAMGLPLIATDVAGCRDVIKDGVNGLIVPVKSSVSLARAMAKMLQMDSASFKIMKDNSRKIVYEGFRKDIIISRYKDILEKYAG